MHCDETDDPLSRHIETLAAETIRFGLQGRVAGSHLTSMHSMDNYYVSKLIPLMAEAGINVIPNPLINIMLQGRHDTYPKRRGMTRVPELMAAGINVAFGHDCVMDPWYSMGSGDMLEVGHMAIHVAQMAGIEDKRKIFDALTVNSAKTMGLEGYGLEKGCNADLVILQAQRSAGGAAAEAEPAGGDPARQGHRPLGAAHRRTLSRRPPGKRSTADWITFHQGLTLVVIARSVVAAGRTLNSFGLIHFIAVGFQHFERPFCCLDLLLCFRYGLGNSLDARLQHIAEYVGRRPRGDPVETPAERGRHGPPSPPGWKRALRISLKSVARIRSSGSKVPGSRSSSTISLTSFSMTIKPWRSRGSASPGS